MSRKTEIMINIYGYIWMASWFIAIWTPKFYSGKFFLTGCFCLVLGLLVYSGAGKKGKDETKKL